MPLIMEGLDSAFTLHRLWEQPDQAGWLRDNAARIRGIGGSYSAYPLTPEGLARFPNLEIISNFGVGYDTVDAAWCGQHGIIVTNTPDVLTDEVADLTVGLLLATIRRLPQADAFLRAGRWLQGGFPLTATLRGRRIGIAGLGRIGKAIARRLEAFGLGIAYTGRHRQDEVPYTYHATLAELAAASDVLISVLPGGAATQHAIDAEVLAALGAEGVFINVGRGSAVDEAALVRALQDGTIAAAGLDVFEDEPRVPPELIELDNTVLLPHVGSASHHTRRLMGQLVVDNLTSWFGAGKPLTPVPETPWPPR
jgi:lactate dehydrogenase-like 2-hydroxyacid dehydrogenase